VTEAAAAAGCLVQGLQLGPVGQGDRGQHQLRDAIAAPNRERLASRVHQDHLDLAAVVRVDGAGRVGEHDPVTQRQPAARADLRLESLGDRDRQAGRHQRPLPRSDAQIPVDGGVEVEARRTGRRPRR
jgi:hypothetical protein